MAFSLARRPCSFALSGPANTCETIGDLNATYRNAHSNFAGQRATLLASLASRFALLRCGWGESRCQMRGSTIETGAGNDRGRIDATAFEASDSAAFGAGPRWQHGKAEDGDPRRYL